MKQIIFDGHKFTKDEKTGYYLKTTLPRTRLHIYVWEYYNNCKVPKGFDIHHKDMNKDNNDISNLECISRSRHNKLHGELLTEEQREKKRKNMDINARPAAIEWHKSEEGRAWHKEQYSKTLGSVNRKKVKMICEYCGAEYETYSNENNRFCSNNCKSAWRRDSGIDNVEKTCEYCGKTFISNKYYKSRFCSNTCASMAFTGSKRTLS